MSSLRAHTLHPGVIHAPLVLLPTAAVLDLVAMRALDAGMARAGRGLWIAASAGGVVSAVTGFAASQEVKARDEHTQHMMFLHGIGNAGVLGGMLLLTAWRMRRGASVAQALAGLAVAGAAMYTADLGGGMVYEHGVGVASMPEDADRGVDHSPSISSPRLPGAFLRDTIRGVGWLARKTMQAVAGG